MTTIRHRLPDAPGCATWNAAIERARAEYRTHPATKFCAFRFEDGDHCYSPAGRGDYCPAHVGVLTRIAREATRGPVKAPTGNKRHPCPMCGRRTRRPVRCLECEEVA